MLLKGGSLKRAYFLFQCCETIAEKEGVIEVDYKRERERDRERERERERERKR